MKSRNSLALTSHQAAQSEVVMDLSKFTKSSLIKIGFCEMNCTTLAENVKKFQPDATTRDVARLCLLLTNAVEDVQELDEPDCLEETWNEIGLRLQAATDQHAAMTEELEELARSDPRRFTPDQIWILIRAIKVQSQVLRLYVGDPAVDVV